MDVIILAGFGEFFIKLAESIKSGYQSGYQWLHFRPVPLIPLQHKSPVTIDITRLHSLECRDSNPD